MVLVSQMSANTLPVSVFSFQHHSESADSGASSNFIESNLVIEVGSPKEEVNLSEG